MGQPATLTGTASGTATTGDQRPAPASHTPGPWFVSRHSVDDFDGWNGIRITSNCDEEGEHVADHKNGGINIGRILGPDAKANARLIAAAPDMLEALQTAHASMTAAGVRGGLDDVCAAIAKATGEAS